MSLAAQPSAGGRPPPRMMRQYELVDRVRRYNPLADEALLNKSYSVILVSISPEIESLQLGLSEEKLRVALGRGLVSVEC